MALDSEYSYYESYDSSPIPIRITFFIGKHGTYLQNGIEEQTYV